MLTGGIYLISGATMTIWPFTTAATWPSGPDIRGRDLIWISALGAAGLVVLFALTSLLDWLDLGAPPPASAPEFETWPKRTAAEFWALNALMGAFYAYSALVVYVVLVRRRRRSWRDLGFRAFGWRWLAVTLLLGGLLFVASDWILESLDLREEAETYNRDLFFVDGANFLTVIAEVLLIGPMTAIVEELYFRGLLHRWIRQKCSRTPGAMLSATVFSLVHFGVVDPGGALGWCWTAEVFVLGGVLALLYEWSGSLWPPILLHAANNVASVMLTHMGG